jgi:hypothetical protein
MPLVSRLYIYRCVDVKVVHQGTFSLDSPLPEAGALSIRPCDHFVTDIKLSVSCM